MEKGVNPDLPLSSGHTALTYAAHRRLTYLSQILVDGRMFTLCTKAHFQNFKIPTSITLSVFSSQEPWSRKCWYKRNASKEALIRNPGKGNAGKETLVIKH